MKLKVLVPSFFFLILFLLSFVSAQPTPFPGAFPEGFNIEFPLHFEVKQNKPHNFTFHTFNSSNGVPITSGISCYFDLYNTDGIHLASLSKSITDSDDIFDYTFELNQNNFSQIGLLSYVIQCNSSTQGGFDAVPVQVTKEGRLNKSIFNNPYIIIFLVLFGIFFLIAYQTKIAWLGFVSGVPLLMAGIYTMIYGFNGITNLYTRSISFIVLGVGIGIMIISAYDWVFAGEES